jgi:hypothetical protein
MAVRGVWQLKKLVVCFCDHSGSSAGARSFSLSLSLVTVSLNVGGRALALDWSKHYLLYFVRRKETASE